ncbi:hypothetical protein TPY_2041 [Sulfobacillus acidophilus TPY]|nr:hypothetical protein TPY_2041 [Sulfobacillus acidophilus TPY]
MRLRRPRPTGPLLGAASTLGGGGSGRRWLFRLSLFGFTDFNGL